MQTVPCMLCICKHRFQLSKGGVPDVWWRPLQPSRIDVITSCRRSLLLKALQQPACYT